MSGQARAHIRPCIWPRDLDLNADGLVVLERFCGTDEKGAELLLVAIGIDGEVGDECVERLGRGYAA